MDEPDADLPSGKTALAAKPTREVRSLKPIGVPLALGAEHDLVTAGRVQQQLEQSLRGALPPLNRVETLEQALANEDANPGERAV
jgi:hypothetical protein